MVHILSDLNNFLIFLYKNQDEYLSPCYNYHMDYVYKLRRVYSSPDHMSPIQSQIHNLDIDLPHKTSLQTNHQASFQNTEWELHEPHNFHHWLYFPIYFPYCPT